MHTDKLAHESGNMSKQVTAETHEAAKTVSAFPKLETPQILSAIRSRWERLGRASNLANVIRTKTEPETIQSKKLRMKKSKALKKAADENIPYKEVLKTVSGFDSKIKQLRDAAKDKTEDEREERSACVKEAKSLDLAVAQTVMSDPKVQALDKAVIADIIEE